MQDAKWGELLDLYFNGETTLEQERMLRRYFSAGKVAPEYEEFIPLFGYMAAEAELIGKEVEFVNFEGEQRDPGGRMFIHRIGRYWKIAVSVAAVVLLLIGGFLVRHESVKEKELYSLMIGGVEVNDKQLAMNIAQDKLDMISNAMGKMNEQTEKMTRATNITKKLKVLQGLSE